MVTRFQVALLHSTLPSRPERVTYLVHTLPVENGNPAAVIFFLLPWLLDVMTSYTRGVLEQLGNGLFP